MLHISLQPKINWHDTHTCIKFFLQLFNLDFFFRSFLWTTSFIDFPRVYISLQYYAIDRSATLYFLLYFITPSCSCQVCFLFLFMLCIACLSLLGQANWFLFIGCVVLPFLLNSLLPQLCVNPGARTGRWQVAPSTAQRNSSSTRASTATCHRASRRSVLRCSSPFLQFLSDVDCTLMNL